MLRSKTLFPHAVGGNRHTTACNRKRDGTCDCEGVKFCNPGHAENCAVTIIGKFTSMFHWAQHNVAAIWLRNHKIVPDNASHARDGVETECFYPRLPGSRPAQ